jgi:DNA-binding transcriptional regulator YiaG
MNTNHSRSSFAAALRSWRKGRRLTQQDAARLLGVPLRTWQNWEIGWRTPPPYRQRLVIRALGSV